MNRSLKRTVLALAAVFTIGSSSAFAAYAFNFQFGPGERTCYSNAYRKKTDCNYGYFKVGGTDSSSSYTFYTICTNANVEATDTIYVQNSDRAAHTPRYKEAYRSDGYTYFKLRGKAASASANIYNVGGEWNPDN